MLELIKFSPEIRIRSVSRESAVTMLEDFKREFKDKTGMEIHYLMKESDTVYLNANSTHDPADTTLIQTVEDHLEKTIEDECTGTRIRSRTRRSGFMLLRQLFIRILLDKGISQSDIGRYLQMDHSTMSYHDSTTRGYIEGRDQKFIIPYTKATEALKFLHIAAHEDPIQALS